MSIKDDLNAVKEELNAQEEMLKNAIHLERFYKKYKPFIIGFAIIIVGLFFANVAKNQLEANTIKQTNVVLYQLKSDPKNQTYLNTLKEKNASLYHLYMLHMMIQEKDFEKASIHSKTLDPFLQDMLAYQSASESASEKALQAYSGDLEELAILEAGYLLLENKQFEEAKKELSKLAITSPLRGYAQALLHYKKGN